MSNRNCFVISPIGDDGSEIRKNADWVYHGLLKDVVDKHTLPLNLKRSDEIPEPGIITNQIIIHITNWADVIFANLTGHNANVFYELALAHAAEKPVITVIQKGESLPFDNAQQRTIFYDLSDIHQLNETRQKLHEQLKEVLRKDYRVSNVVTSAKGQQKLLEGADSRDKMLSDVIEQIQFLSARITEQDKYIKEIRNASMHTFPSTLTLPNRLGVSGMERLDFLTSGPIAANTKNTSPATAFPSTLFPDTSS